MLRPPASLHRSRSLTLLLVLSLAGGAVLAGARPVGAAAVPGARVDGPPLSFVVAMQQPSATPDEFVPVAELPPQEQLAAAPLLIAAYAFVWVALLGYITMLWRRLARVEREIADVSRQIDGRRRS